LYDDDRLSLSASHYYCSKGLLNVEEVDKLISLNLKLGKIPGIDNIVAEHTGWAKLSDTT